MARNLEDLLLQAARPTVEMIERMVHRVSRGVRPILLTISQEFWQPGYKVDVLLQSGISKRSLRPFHAEVGVPPGRLIRECRMESALRFFLETLLTVEEIALLIGYDSHRSLERNSLSWCGLTPADLRTSLRGVRTDLRGLPDDVFSWYYWYRYSRQELGADELDPVVAYLETLIGRL